MTWFSRQEKLIRVCLVILAVLIPMTIGMLITERFPIRVTTSVECTAIPTDRTGKCPPGDERPVLTYVVPVERNRYGIPFWRVQAWTDDSGWSYLVGTSSYRVHTWVELPEVDE